MKDIKPRHPEKSKVSDPVRTQNRSEHRISLQTPVISWCFGHIYSLAPERAHRNGGKWRTVRFSPFYFGRVTSDGRHSLCTMGDEDRALWKGLLACTPLMSCYILIPLYPVRLETNPNCCRQHFQFCPRSGGWSHLQPPQRLFQSVSTTCALVHFSIISLTDVSGNRQGWRTKRGKGFNISMYFLSCLYNICKAI